MNLSVVQIIKGFRARVIPTLKKMSSKDSNERYHLQRLFLEWMSAAVANGFASAVLNPMDVSKTRMQALDAASGFSTGLLKTLRTLYREEGLIGLWKPGLNASLARELLYSGPRAGFYVPLRNFFQKEFSVPDSDDGLTKICAALATGKVYYITRCEYSLTVIFFQRHSWIFHCQPSRCRQNSSHGQSSSVSQSFECSMVHFSE
jgi:hypothetical protein